MTNEYGVKLDRNGYAPSIAYQTGCCPLCGRRDRPLQRHEAFHGAYREKSKRLGCWLYICDICHDRVHHKDAALDLYVKRLMQTLATEHYGWNAEQFRKEYGKNYLDAE